MAQRDPDDTFAAQMGLQAVKAADEDAVIKGMNLTPVTVPSGGPETNNLKVLAAQPVSTFGTVMRNDPTGPTEAWMHSPMIRPTGNPTIDGMFTPANLLLLGSMAAPQAIAAVKASLPSLSDMTAGQIVSTAVSFAKHPVSSTLRGVGKMLLDHLDAEPEAEAAAQPLNFKDALSTGKAQMLTNPAQPNVKAGDAFAAMKAQVAQGASPYAAAKTVSGNDPNLLQGLLSLYSRYK